MILPGLAILILFSEFVLGSGGCIEIKPGEVGVRYNNTGIPLLGDRDDTIVDQGVQTFLPGLQSFEKLERRPQILVMANENTVESKRTAVTVGDYQVSGGIKVSQRVKALTVRARDGSNFFFDRLEVHYQVIPRQAHKVIDHLGPGNSYKEKLLATYSRGVLRDQFGSYSFLEIADPTTYGAATTDARTKLNEMLDPFGIEVIQIVTPKPSFDARVEHAIEDRQNAEQEIEVQAEKRRKLEQEAGLKVQNIAQAKNAEYQALLAELEARKKGAENKLLSVKREADKYFIEREASGNAYMQEKILRAKANAIAYRKEAEGLVAKIKAIGDQGPDVLNQVIAKKVFPQLQNVSATPLLQPTTPIDIRHIGQK